MVFDEPAESVVYLKHKAWRQLALGTILIQFMNCEQLYDFRE